MNKRSILFIGAALCINIFASLAITTVNVKKPGGLAAELAKKNNLKELKIKGALNSADIKALREVCGSDSMLETHTSAVSLLNLRDVTFAPDTALFGSKKAMFINDNAEMELPVGLLYGCPIDSIILPKGLTKINRWALGRTGIRYLHIPNGVEMAPNSLMYDSLLVSLRLPASNIIFGLNNQKFNSLRTLSIGSTDYVYSGAFTNLPALEQVKFEGLIGHIDGYQFRECPELRRVIFNGPIVTNGGPDLVNNCPKMEEIIYNGFTVCGGFVGPDRKESPNFKGSVFNGPVLYTNDSTVVMPIDVADALEKPGMRAQAERIVNRHISVLTDSNNRYDPFMRKMALALNDKVVIMANILDRDTAMINQLAAKEKIRIDYGKTKLQVLQESAPYRSDDVNLPAFRYTPSTDSLLAMTRQRFNLDSIAGNGDDLSRIKRLTYWLHDLIPHAGTSGWPEVPFHFCSLYDEAKAKNRGYNCRFLAMMLTELLLAEDIPARYLTCQSKQYDTDSDCHVICVAWSKELGKWVWADPSFAAFPTDENGTPLHPGEVRQRLIDNKPLLLNGDANWNHKQAYNVDNYLKTYMAKNLYIITANSYNGPLAEGSGAKGKPYVTLIPEGFKYSREDILTTDSDRFWAAPIIK